MIEAASTMMTDEALQRLLEALKPNTAIQPEMPAEEMGFIFAKLADELTPALQSIVPIAQCALGPSDFLRYSESLEASGSALYIVARQNDQAGFVLFRLGAVGVEWWLTQSLGGQSSQTAAAAQRSISTIEARVGRIAVDFALGALARLLSSWSVDVAFHECKLATEFKDVPHPQDDPLVYRVAISIAPESENAILEIFVSEPLWGKWCDAVKELARSDDSVAQAKPVDNAWQDVLSHTLEAVPVMAEAILCQQEIDLSEIAVWRPGHVIALEATSDSLVDLMSGEMPLLRGVLGKRDGRLCLRVAG